MTDQARATGRCGDTSTTSTDVIAPLTVCALPYGHQGWHRADNGAEWSREPASTAEVCCDECTHAGRTSYIEQARFHTDRAVECSRQARSHADNAVRHAREAAAAGRKATAAGAIAVVLAVAAVVLAFL